MKIGPEDNRASLRRRWGVPLSVATGVAGMSVAAVAVFSGVGDAEPLLAGPAGNPTSAAAPTSPGPASPSADASSAADRFAITSGTTTPIDAGTVTKILASCLGSDASRFEPVLAVRTPVASPDSDGVVVAKDSTGQYVQCQSTGDKGITPNSPPTFINDRLWGTGRTIAYFDSFTERVGKGQYLLLGAGHHTSDIVKITISYGDDPKQYPAVMAGGAFVYAAALSTDDPDPRYSGPSPYVHAYDASGKEVYNQKKDPQFTDER